MWKYAPLVAAALLGAACSEAPLAMDVRPPQEPLRYVPPETCDSNTTYEYGDPCYQSPTANHIVGWPYYDFTPWFTLPAGDPYPGWTGVYLGSDVSPARCYAENNPGGIVDSDRDWLADHCEYTIARAFAPQMVVSAHDGSAEAEPYWAATYFKSEGVVRLGYLLSYYADGGEHGWPQFTAHSGDSEFVMVEVKYNAQTQHWYFNQMWLSAHYDAEFFGIDGDRSEWVGADRTEWADEHSGGRPRVWVAEDKHANYRSYAACDHWYMVNTNWTQERCGSGTDMRPTRVPVYSDRNVGSSHTPLLTAVPSKHRYAGNGRYEYYYSNPVHFRGWQSNLFGEAPPSYYNMLRSDKFEHVGSYRAQGPTPPNFDFAVSVTGPATVDPYTTNTWKAATRNGVAPFTFSWTVNGRAAGTGASLTYTAPGCEALEFRIGIKGTDSAGTVSTNTYKVKVQPYC